MILMILTLILAINALIGTNHPIITGLLVSIAIVAYVVYKK